MLRVCAASGPHSHARSRAFSAGHLSASVEGKARASEGRLSHEGELAKDKLTELAEDELTELAENELTELAEDELTELRTHTSDPPPSRTPTRA